VESVIQLPLFLACDKRAVGTARAVTPSERLTSITSRHSVQWTGPASMRFSRRLVVALSWSWRERHRCEQKTLIRS